jgi:hypothetical protein
MRTDRELTALFTAALADERPDPTFLDELFEVLVVESAGLRATGAPSPAPLARRPMGIRGLASARLTLGRFGSLDWPLAAAAAAAAAAALILAVATVALVVRPYGLVGPAGVPTAPPSPSPTPGPTYQVLPATTFRTFTSTTYGYTVGYPSNWQTSESPGRLDPTTYPYDFSGGVDYLSATSPNVLDPGLVIAGPRLTRVTTLAGWMANIAQLQATAIACAAPDATEAATVAGLPAQIDTWNDCPEYILWAGFVRGDVGYHVLLIDQFATDNPPLQATDRAMFLRILGTFAFTGPVETFGPSAAASVSPTP